MPCNGWPDNSTRTRTSIGTIRAELVRGTMEEPMEELLVVVAVAVNTSKDLGTVQHSCKDDASTTSSHDEPPCRAESLRSSTASATVPYCTVQVR